MSERDAPIGRNGVTEPRLLLLVPSLGAGGAERVVSVLANTWAGRGCTVAVMTLDTAGDDFFALHPSIHRLRLDRQPAVIRALGGLARNIARILALRRGIRSFAPAAVISFTSRCNVLAILATLELGARTIVSERTDPVRHAEGALWAVLRRLTYCAADAVVAQSEAAADWLRRHTAVKPDAIAVIPNPAIAPASIVVPARSAAGESRVRTVLTVGRLSDEKGFDLLLRAFAMVAPAHPEWHLLIVGEGRERDALSAIAAASGMAQRVNIVPPVKDLASVYARADLFVLPSRYEGFPNALLEAMAHGLPTIGFDGSAGPRAIIRHDVDGLLVPSSDIEALAAALARLMTDEAARARFGARAPDVIQRFDAEAIVRKWEQVAQAVSAGGRRAALGKFAFGKNWARFVKEIDEQRIHAATRSIRRSLGTETLEGSDFLDVGSGSGLFSLAARRFGARVHSFDCDADSVRCAHALKRRYFTGDDQWRIEAGDVLNRAYLQSLPRFDVVYAWGVLHHTGAMWQAIDNLLPVVKSGGRIVLAIYNAQGARSRYWAAIKAIYNKAPRFARAVILALACVRLWGPTTLRDLVRGRPAQTWRSYSRERGMSPWRDVVDWVGGFPFEVASPEEVVRFVAARGFSVEYLKTCGNGLGCNEFTFQRTVQP